MFLLVAARFQLRGRSESFFIRVHRISRLTRWHKRAFFSVLNLARKITTSALFSSNLNRSLWMNFIYKKETRADEKKTLDTYTHTQRHTHTFKSDSGMARFGSVDAVSSELWADAGEPNWNLATATRYEKFSLDVFSRSQYCINSPLVCDVLKNFFWILANAYLEKF